MKYASEELRAEHEAILFGLNILEKMANGAKKPGAADTKDIGDMIGFLRVFADKCHHGKEEGLLFPVLEKAGVPKRNGPIGQMLLEHVEGRQYIAAMDASLQSGVLDGTAFAAAAENYIDLLRSHIDKENDILFPLGDRVLTDATQQCLLEQFEEHEETVMGKDTYEKFHGLLEQLGEKYLG